MDAVDATPVRHAETVVWRADAKAALDQSVERFPVLTRISAAKRLRDAGEARAREAGATEVSLTHFRAAEAAMSERAGA